MNGTMSKKTAKKPAKNTQLTLPEIVEPAAVASVSAAKTETTLDFLKKDCMEVSIEISWLTTSKQIEQVLAQKMVKAVDASKSSTSLSKKLFDSKHPDVKAANAAKNAITAFRDSMTIPVAALPPQGATDPKAFVMKEAGTRLILTEQIDSFVEKLDYLIGNLHTAVAKLNANLESVKASDKANLGSLYNEDDYPESIIDLISVRGPQFRTVGYTTDFEKLAPKACERAMKQLQQRLEGTVNLAASDFAQALLSVTAQVANQLSNRTRLLFDKDHPLAKYRDAEVVTMCTHQTHPDDVAEGTVLLEVRYMPASETRTSTVWLEPIPVELYEKVKSETDERKKVHESSVDNLRGRIESFMKVGVMLGEAGKPIKEAVDQLNTLLQEGGSNTSEILNEMRTSNRFRRDLNAKMQLVTEALSGHLVTLNVAKPKRRSIGKVKSKAGVETPTSAEDDDE